VPTCEAGADAPNVIHDLIDGIEPVVAFQHDGVRRLPSKRVIEEIERPVRHRVGVAVGEDGTLQITFLNRYAPGEMHFLCATGSTNGKSAVE
jgi:hypothetical protein